MTLGKLIILISIIWLLTLICYIAVIYKTKNNLNWTEAEHKITKDCKSFQSNFLYYSSKEYSISLIKKMNTKKNGTTSAQAIKTNSGFCWVVWIGEQSGKGVVIYEDVSGNFNKVNVKNFI